MRLDTAIRGINFTQELSQANRLIQEAEGYTTLWGERVIRVPGYEGTFPIQEVVKKVHKASRTRLDERNLLISERLAGAGMAKKVKKLIDDADKNANIVAKIVHWIREFFLSLFCPSDPLFFFSLDNFGADHFLAFSDEDCRFELGLEESSQNSMKYPHVTSTFGISKGFYYVIDPNFLKTIPH